MSVIVHSRLISGLGNLIERVLAQPQRRVERTTLAAPRSIVGLCVDKTVVLTVGADPEPVDAILARQAENTIMNADSGTEELTAAEKRVEAMPEPRRRRVVHKARGEWFL